MTIKFVVSNFLVELAHPLLSNSLRRSGLCLEHLDFARSVLILKNSFKKKLYNKISFRMWKPLIISTLIDVEFRAKFQLET